MAADSSALPPFRFFPPAVVAVFALVVAAPFFVLEGVAYDKGWYWRSSPSASVCKSRVLNSLLCPATSGLRWSRALGEVAATSVSMALETGQEAASALIAR